MKHRTLTLCSVFSLLALSLASNHAFAACTPETLKLARVNFANAEKMEAEGLVAHYFTLQAQLILTEALECSGTILKPEYCASIEKTLGEIKMIAMSETGGSSPELHAALLKQIEFERRCK
jgi:hypothetical protein